MKRTVATESKQKKILLDIMLSAASMFKNMLNIRENVKKDQKLAVIKDQAIQDQLTSVTSQSFF